MRSLLPFGLIAAGMAQSCAAQRPLPQAGELLGKIYAYSERYSATLPSLSCDERIVSQELRGGVVTKEVAIESTLREVRTGPSTFEEKHNFRTVNGDPAVKKTKIPYFVQGGFANAIGFKDRSREACYTYAVSAESGDRVQLTIAGRPDGATCKEIPEDYRKMVLVDAGTGRIEHVERTISAKAAKRMKETFFASVDYGSQSLGDETLWLPVKMTAHDEKEEGRMVVTYSNYHRYAGHATIQEGASTEVP